MWLPMLVQMPSLFALGIVLRGSTDGPVRTLDVDLAGWIFVATTLTIWMIPAAMDAAVASVGVDVAKFLTVVISGALSRRLLQHGSGPLALFFVTNIVCMTAIAGMLYLGADLRLCNAYLLDDQVYAGRGLIALALCLGGTALVLLGRRGLDALVGGEAACIRSDQPPCAAVRVPSPDEP
jgi:hypothetical protein